MMTDEMPSWVYQERDNGDYRSSPLTRGPWNKDHQHAGPPVALVCRAFERAAVREGLTHLSRLTANLLPISPSRFCVARSATGSALMPRPIRDRWGAAWPNRGCSIVRGLSGEPPKAF
jgi:hypothetical protein